jgi:hypothetical protein
LSIARQVRRIGDDDIKAAIAVRELAVISDEAPVMNPSPGWPAISLVTSLKWRFTPRGHQPSGPELVCTSAPTCPPARASSLAARLLPPCSHAT